jgi:Cu/Ag efflux pump CusA
MRSVVSWSVRFRVLVVGLAAGLVVLGVAVLPNAPIDALPEVSPPYVEVQTEALGLSAEDVEQLITVPLEADLLNGVAWLDSIESESVTGLSSIVLTFEPGTDPVRARQMVAERLTQAHALPNVSKPPVMLQPLSSANRLMMIGLSSDEHSLIDMSVLARWTIRPRLMGVPGVANVSIWGQRERQLQVLVDPAHLHAAGVSLDDVVEATGNALWVSPLTFLEASTPGTGGFIDTPNQRLGVQHLFPISSPEDLERIAVAGGDGHRYRLSDLATVVEDHQLLIGDALVSDGAGLATGLLLVIEKFPEANTLEVTRAVEDAMAALEPGLDGIRVDTSVFRPASFLESATGGLALAALIGLGLLAVVLVGLMRSWRAAVVSLVAIPVSLVAAGLVLYVAGATVNAMLVAGFVIAIGVVVDDAVSTTSSVLRRMSASESGELGRREAVIAAVLEVRGPKLYATVVLALAVIPLFLLDGVSGALMPTVLVSYLVALVTSTIVAMTVTPALMAVLMPADASIRTVPGPIAAVQRVYGTALVRLLSRTRPVYAVVAVTTVGVVALVALSMAPRLAALDAPAFRERDLLVRFDAPAGTSHPEMQRIVAQGAGELQRIPGVRNVGAHVGRAVLSDEVSNINTGEIWFSIDEDADYDATLAAVEQTIDGYPGLERQISTHPEARLTDIAGIRADDVVVRVYGADMEVLRAKATEVRDAMAGIEGVADAAVEPQIDEPAVTVVIDLDAAARHHLKPGEIRRAAATLLAGVEVGSIFEEQKVFDVIVWGAPRFRDSVTSVEELPIVTSTGSIVRLGDVAEVEVAPAASVIRRDAVQRRIDIGASIEGRDPSSVLADVQAAIDRIDFPLENHAEVLGVTAERAAAGTSLLAISIAVLAGIFLVLQAAFGNWRLALAVFVGIPAAVSGGVIMALILGDAGSLGPAMGLVAALGIALHLAVQLVGEYRRLEVDRTEEPGLGLVLRGAHERLLPSMTTLLGTTALIAPFAVLAGRPGFEIVGPMALVTLGGLVSTAALTLFFIPTAFQTAGLAGAQETVAIPVEGASEPETVGAR